MLDAAQAEGVGGVVELDPVCERVDEAVRRKDAEEGARQRGRHPLAHHLGAVGNGRHRVDDSEDRRDDADAREGVADEREDVHGMLGLLLLVGNPRAGQVRRDHETGRAKPRRRIDSPLL